MTPNACYRFALLFCRLFVCRVCVGTDTLFARLWFQRWLAGPGNVCGCEGSAYYLILFFINSVRLVVNGNADALPVE